MKHAKQFRILSIDGGGIKGAFPAAFLAEIEKDIGEPLHKYFDLIVGTSTGGIIALGLALNIPAYKILAMYQEHGPQIFPYKQNTLLNFFYQRWKKITHFFCTKYKSDALKKALEEVLKDSKISDCKTRVLIPAWDTNNQQVHVFKTAHHTRFTRDYKELAVDVALSTSAAPTYFKQHRTQGGLDLIDGGVWANNPISQAVVEAIAILDWPANELNILSIGTTNEKKVIKPNKGLFGASLSIADMFMGAQDKNSLAIATLLTGHKHKREAILRINPNVPPKIFTLDNACAIDRLTQMGKAHAHSELPHIKQTFFKTKVTPFQSLHLS